MNCSKCGGPKSPRLVRVRWQVVAALFACGFLGAYVLGGGLLHDLVEGQQRDILPLWKLFVPLGLLIAATVAAFARWRQLVCAKCNEANPSALLAPIDLMPSAVMVSTDKSRRSFLRIAGGVGTGVVAAAGGVGLAVARNREWLPVADDFFRTQVENQSPTRRPQWKDSKVVQYRRLGRTDVMVSDISFGSSRVRDVEVALDAIDRGINYFDTAPDYADTGSEQVLGEAIQQRQRDKIFLATKFCRGNGHLHDDTPVPEIIATVEDSLKRLRTDYVDLIHIHSCDRLERLHAPNIHEAFDRLKEQGKVRFLGVSTHTPNLEEVANAAIDSGRFDVMMLAYHYGMWPNFGHILDKAKANDVGIVAMKTLKGAKHQNLADFREEADSYTQSAFKWVLSNPAVGCLVVSISTHEQVEEYLYASGRALAATDVASLDKYDKLVAGDYCQPHCGVCLGTCPQALPINDILRHRMYFKDYGSEKEAMALYAALERKATLCDGCSAPCESVCPTQVRIHDNLLDAHRLLSYPA